MSQVLKNKATYTRTGLAYSVLALLPIVLKLLGRSPVATWPWSKVTFTIWGPWLLVVVMSALGWVVYQVQTRRA